MMDIHWTLTVLVPQLDTINQTLLTLGDTLVETIDSIKQELIRLNENQAQGAAAIAAQIERIADEAEQYGAQGTPVTPEQMNNLGAAIRQAADAAAKQAADVAANTQAIGGIVPETPPA